MRAFWNSMLRRWADSELLARSERLERENRLLTARLEVVEVQLELQQQVIAREHARVSAEIQIQSAREAEHRA